MLLVLTIATTNRVQLRQLDGGAELTAKLRLTATSQHACGRMRGGADDGARRATVLSARVVMVPFGDSATGSMLTTSRTRMTTTTEEGRLG